MKVSCHLISSNQ